MVLPDVQAVLRLDALVGDARPHHLRQAVDVDGVHGEGVLDLAAHGVRPRLGAEDADLQRRRARVDAAGAELVEDRQHVARRHHDDVRREVLQKLHLPLGHAAGHRDDRAAEPLRPVVGAEAAGEQAVAVGDVHLHAGPAAARADRAGDDVGPDLEVALRIADDSRPAGGARRGVDAGDLVLRHGEHAEGVVGPQVVLRREGELREVRQGAEIVGVHAGGLEGLTVMRHVLVGVAQRPGEALHLQAGDLVARGGLDRLEVAGAGREVRQRAGGGGEHGGPPRMRSASSGGGVLLQANSVVRSSRSAGNARRWCASGRGTRRSPRRRWLSRARRRGRCGPRGCAPRLGPPAGRRGARASGS